MKALKHEKAKNYKKKFLVRISKTSGGLKNNPPHVKRFRTRNKIINLRPSFKNYSGFVHYREIQKNNVKVLHFLRHFY